MDVSSRCLRGRFSPLEDREVLERLRRRSPLLRRQTCWIRLETPGEVEQKTERIDLVIKGVQVWIQTYWPLAGSRAIGLRPLLYSKSIFIQSYAVMTRWSVLFPRFGTFISLRVWKGIGEKLVLIWPLMSFFFYLHLVRTAAVLGDTVGVLVVGPCHIYSQR